MSKFIKLTKKIVLVSVLSIGFMGVSNAIWDSEFIKKEEQQGWTTPAYITIHKNSQCYVSFNAPHGAGFLVTETVNGNESYKVWFAENSYYGSRNFSISAGSTMKIGFWGYDYQATYNYSCQ